MSSCSPSSSKEFNISSHLQQSPKPISHSTQSDPPTELTPEPDLENLLIIGEDGKADEHDKVNPERSSSLVSVEVSGGPDVNSVPDGMLISPSYSSRRTQKRKKGKGVGSYKKQKAIEKKLQTLSERLNLVPFIPSKALDFVKYEMLLRSLGLLDFVSIGLASDFNSIRCDLVAQLIATYDPKARCSYVNDVRIKVNRADLARAFKLPLKKEKNGNVLAIDAEDLDVTAVSSESCLAFLEDFVSNWIILNNNEELWIMPEELVNLTRPIKDGHPEKMDWSTLLWFMVEQELILGEQLVHCNYASHLQHLIRSQREKLLSMEPEGVTVLQERDSDKLILMEEPKIGGEMCEEEVLEKKDDGDEEEILEVKDQDKEDKVPDKNNDGDKEEVLEIKGQDTVENVLEKNNDGDEVEVLLEEVKGQDTVEKVPEKKDDDEELLEKDQDKEEEALETEDGVKEEVLETNDGAEEEVLEKKADDGEEEVLEKDQHNDEVLDMKDDVEEESLEKKDDAKQEEEEEEVLEKNDNANEEAIIADEVRELGEEDNNVKGGPSIELTLGQEHVIEEVSKDVEMVDFEEFKYDHVEQNQSHWLLNGNNTESQHFLQPCSTHDNQGPSDYIDEKNVMEEAGMEAENGFDDVLPPVNEFEGEGLDVNFLETMVGPKLTYGGSSYYDNNGKRKIDDDVHTSRHANDYKRIRTEEDSSERQPRDLLTCMEEMQLLLDKAKTMYMEKEEDQEHSNMNQEILLNELQERDTVIEQLHQIKQVEIEKRDLQIFRLNRELFLMCSLLDDYKKALKQTDKAFNEYRQKVQLIEESMYKDTGDKGLVLSITDIEKRTQKEEERMKLEIEQKVKEAEEGYAFQFEEFLHKVNGLDKKLLVFEYEFKSIKDSYSKPKISETSVLASND